MAVGVDRGLTPLRASPSAAFTAGCLVGVVCLACLACLASPAAPAIALPRMTARRTRERLLVRVSRSGVSFALERWLRASFAVLVEPVEPWIVVAGGGGLYSLVREIPAPVK